MKLMLGDCLETLKTLPDSSVDSVVTDPPYGLSFMGKKWDYSVPSVEIWKEILRVLKPGGHVLSFCGTRTYHRMVVNMEDAGFEIRDQLQWIYGSGFPKSHNGAHGGTALKPANEPICLARKPLEGTVAKNFEKWGVGGLNIDASRIEVSADDPNHRSTKATPNDGTHFKGIGGVNYGQNSQGRWPANVLLDETAAEILDQQSGTLKTGGKKSKDSGAYSAFGGGAVSSQDHFIGDSGGASRFFYVAKASKRERGEGNVHPTVKPIKLMQYLVRMITPPGGIVLDPFMGSGTTGVAAKQLDYDFIGCELSPEYLEIAEKRINNAKK